MTDGIKNCRCMPECVCKPASTTPDSPPAFPLATIEGYACDGLSTRAYFAAHAPITVKDALDYLRETDRGCSPDYTTVLRTLAQMRMAYADAMLEAGAV